MTTNRRLTWRSPAGGRAGQRVARSAPGLALVLVLSSCIVPSGGGPELGTISPTPSASASATASATATPSLPAAHDLYVPGLAAEVVGQLAEAAAGRPIVRVVLDRTMARLTFVAEGDRPASVVWQAGVITPSDDGTDLVAAVAFDPARFNLSDVAALFSTAAEISGSRERQQLQINEYDHGDVFMTVTTTPESTTVFFDREGSPIPRLDLSVDADIARGLADVLNGRLLVVAVGITESEQVWADLVTSPGVIERRIRPAKMPMYLAQRREEPNGEQFDVSVVDPAVLGNLLRSAALMLEEDADSPVSLQVSQPAGSTVAQIVVDVAGSEVVTDLMGVPVTDR